MTDQQNLNDPEPRTDDEIEQGYRRQIEIDKKRRKSLKPAPVPQELAEQFKGSALLIVDSDTRSDLESPTEYVMSDIAQRFLQSIEDGDVMLDNPNNLSNKKLIESYLVEWVKRNIEGKPYFGDNKIYLDHDIIDIVLALELDLES